MHIRPPRLLVAACLVLACATLQACAMTTGAYVPARGAASNRSMMRNYDAFGQPVARQRTVNRTMTVMHDKGGVADYRYY
ncbi:hypothetical protein BH11GEM1_BH11GEM1_00970 [soil metagenome]